MTRTPRPKRAAAGVSASARSPLYHQIFLILRDEILAGTYKDGDILPSEFELTRIYNVSRITAKQALDEIAAAGLANRYRGRGTVVSHRPHTPPLRASVTNWLESASVMGRTTRVKLTEFGYGHANAEEAEALRIADGDEVQRSTRIRLQGNAPFSLLMTVVPGGIGHTYTADELAATPLLELLHRAGRAVDHAQQVITATLANQANAALLETEVGAPLLKLQRIVFDGEGRAVEYLTALYRPDRYQFEMMLSSEQAVVEMGDPISGGVLGGKSAI